MRSRNLFITTAYYPFPPLLVSHSPNKLSFIIYFFLIYHFYASFRPPTRVYFQGFLLPASDRQMFFLFSLGRETWPPSRKSCFFSFSWFRASCKEFVSHGRGHSPKRFYFHSLFIYLSMFKYRSTGTEGWWMGVPHAGDLAQGKWPTTFNWCP